MGGSRRPPANPSEVLALFVPEGRSSSICGDAEFYEKNLSWIYLRVTRVSWETGSRTRLSGYAGVHFEKATMHDSENSSRPAALGGTDNLVGQVENDWERQVGRFREGAIAPRKSI